MAMCLCLVLAISFGMGAALDVTGSIDEAGHYFVVHTDMRVDYGMGGKRIMYEIKFPQTYDGIVMTAYNKSMIDHVYDENMDCQTKVAKASPYIWPLSQLPTCKREGDIHVCYGDLWLEAKYGHDFQVVFFNCGWEGIKVNRYYFSDTGMVSGAGTTQVYSILGLIIAAAVAFM